MIAVVGLSGSLHEPALDFYKGIFRQLWNKYEDSLVLRMPKTKPLNEGRLVFDFLEDMQVPMELYPTVTGGDKYASEIRIKRMLTGVHYSHDRVVRRCPGCSLDHPPDWPHPEEIRDPADIVLTFLGKSGAGYPGLLRDLTLKAGCSYPLYVYREKWSAKKKGRDQKFTGKITLTARNPERTLSLGKEKLVWSSKPATS